MSGVDRVANGLDSERTEGASGASWACSKLAQPVADGSILRNANGIQYCHVEVANAHIHMLPKLD
jgi:hypothetical protein